MVGYTVSALVSSAAFPGGLNIQPNFKVFAEVVYWGASPGVAD